MIKTQAFRISFAGFDHANQAPQKKAIIASPIWVDKQLVQANDTNVAK